uniref:Serine/threonine protein kinase n=1 Tax=Cyanothece sp. (strain PCC 7425 / ATCC 29141) TaxID=395961 RepID=B8HTJ8_CYAP4
MIGTVLDGRYQIIEKLGQGAFGATYLAINQRQMGRYCVVKHHQPDSTDPALLQEAQRRFEVEAQILAKLGQAHDQIPDLLDFFSESGEFYLVQEFIEGQTLSTEISHKQRLTEPEAVQLLRDVLEVLRYVHQERIIHRDIKPSNLIRRHKDQRIVLVDFGIVKQTQAQAVTPKSRFIVGTPGYIPPEQAQGYPLFCSDIYALGMTAIEALTGTQPHELAKDAETGEVLWKHVVQVSPELAAILDKMVCFYFANRYQSVTEVFQALDRAGPIWESLAVQPQLSPAAPPTGLSATQFTTPSLRTDAILAMAESVSRELEPHLEQPNVGPPAPVNNSLPTAPNLIAPKPIAAPHTVPTKLEPRSFPTFRFEIITVDHQGRLKEQSPGVAEYFRENLGMGVTLDLVRIPGGKFLMGAPSDEADSLEIERPQHRVTVPTFWMGKYPVTQEQWLAVASLPKVKLDLDPNPAYFKGKYLPVETISWMEAVEFCDRLSQHTGCTYRLPTEAEWEYACRAGTTTPFHFGETLTPALANYNGSKSAHPPHLGPRSHQTTTVGSFPPNAFGLYDMHGNVWEWCEDNWHDNYQEAPRDGTAWLGFSSDRLLRGGSAMSELGLCRSANRNGRNGIFRFNFNGFRVVGSPD